MNARQILSYVLWDIFRNSEKCSLRAEAAEPPLNYLTLILASNFLASTFQFSELSIYNPALSSLIPFHQSLTPHIPHPYFLSNHILSHGYSLLLPSDSILLLFPNPKKLPEEIFPIDRLRKGSIENASWTIDVEFWSNSCWTFFFPIQNRLWNMESFLMKFQSRINVEFSLLKTYHQSTHFWLEFWLKFGRFSINQKSSAGFSTVHLVCRNIISIIHPLIY